jgi:thiamine kinase-like enzyme
MATVHLDEAASEVLRRGASALGWKADSLGQVRLLTGGVSGSRTFRVSRPEGDAVLKVTLEGLPEHVLERARREVLFYWYLEPTLPLRVPRLLASKEGRGGCAAVLLLEAFEPLPPVRTWDRDLRNEVVRQLAVLHSEFTDGEEELSGYEWLGQPLTPDPQHAVTDALALWEGLAASPLLTGVLTQERLEGIRLALDALPSTLADVERLPLTLCHGDCHAGNLLQDPEQRLVWADWQEVRLGRGVEDLSFLLQRAQGEGASLPEGALIAKYQWSLARRHPDPPSVEALTLGVSAVELRQRLLEWPHYLQESPDGMERNVLRIEELASPFGF